MSEHEIEMEKDPTSEYDGHLPMPVEKLNLKPEEAKKE